VAVLERGSAWRGKKKYKVRGRDVIPLGIVEKGKDVVLFLEKDKAFIISLETGKVSQEL
jgi:hypothetical protein